MTNEELFEKGMFDELYKQNTGFIYKLSYKFRNIPQDEVISAANLGFTKALKTYSLDKDIKFLTYASRCMVNEILMQTRQLKKQSKDISLEGSLKTDEEGKELTLEDMLQDKCDIEADFMDKAEIENLKATINKLPEKHREVTKLYLQGVDQKQTAKKMGISQSYVSRLRVIAVNRLKKLMRGRDYMSKKPEIIKLIKEGLDNKEIAKRVNSTTGAVATCRCEYNKGLKELLLKYFKEGRTNIAISKETGIDARTLEGYRIKWTHQSTDHKDEGKKEIVKPIDEDNPVNNIYVNKVKTIPETPVQCNKSLLTPTQFSGTIGEYFIKNNAIQVTVKESQNTINIPKENLKLLIQEMMELDKRIAG